MTTVILSQPQRDGLRDFVGSHIGRDLSHPARDGDEAEIKEFAGILPRCIQTLDQIGWEDHGSSQRYEVVVADDLVKLAGEIRPSIEGTIRDDLRGGDELSAGDLRVLESDRQALAAVDLIERTVA
jgi:hypothetical protein